MSTQDFFTKPIAVCVTMNDLYEISSALATQYFKERDAGWIAASEKTWQLREEIGKYIDMYRK